ncbi:hypothetical protein H2200_009274 [Cladophialophora chaetospira]|uniref:Heterokaryon incompatibility domain-containing protein n=1 Tax=Cladophialophora chaetospira TaxID=386627 RepID=A0AA38X436_9EURO|nr:hypothetical protein H2200_009274 [Cladophialophora chaetospira]
MADPEGAEQTEGPRCPPYIKVHKERREIRLIDFSPTYGEEGIALAYHQHRPILRIRSRVHSLSTLENSGGIPYTAISYTWGSPSIPRKPIELNGYIVYISENLESALWLFAEISERTHRAEARFWGADALCVDQKNKQEKSWQVRLMGQIYSTVTVVRVWLGDGNEHSDRAVEQLRRMEERIESLVCLSLPELISEVTLSGSQAVNPRDMIYPFLSMAIDGHTFDITPDYTAAVQTVYTDVAVAILRKGLVRLLGYGGMDKNITGLPSWVPDWTDLKQFTMAPGESAHTAFYAPSLYSASRGDWSPEFSPQDQPTTIIVAALLFDTTSVVGDCYRKSDEDATCRADETVRSAKSIQYREEIPWVPFMYTFPKLCECYGKAYRPGDDVLWRTPILDVQPENPPGRYHPKRATAVAFAGYRLLNESVKNGTASTKPSSLGDVADLYATYSIPNIVSKRSFATAKGYIGMGPFDMNEGDVIAIIIGVEVPIILRESSDGTYQIVGEAYVHGIMDGEAMDDPNAEVKRIVIK